MLEGLVKNEKKEISSLITAEEYVRMLKLVGGDAREFYVDIYFEAETKPHLVEDLARYI